MPLAKVQLMTAPGGPGDIGAVKPGTGITISADGTISASGGEGGSVTSVQVSGGTTGLTFSGGPVTSSGTITMGGVLDIANGGTGATSLAGLQTAVFPTQTGQSGNYLTTNGTTTSWGTVVSSIAGSGGISASAASGAVTVSFPIENLPALP